jgi:DNA (cytosine-5)-methyltransferase 1
LSVAGQRKGLSGERSGLFFDFMRIAEAMLPRLKWVVLENVPGLLTSHGGGDFHAVLSTLADVGFHDRAYRILDSRYFGVAQRRRRVFIVGRAGAEFGRAGAVLLEPARGGRDSAPGGEAWARVTRGAADRADGPVAFNWYAAGEMSVGLTRPTLKVSDGHAPAIAFDNRDGITSDVTATLRADCHGANPMVASALTSSMGHHGHGSPRGDGSDNLVAATLNSGGNAGGFRTEPGEHLVAPTLLARGNRTGGDRPPGSDPESAETLQPTAHGVRRLTPRECERLQGFPDGHTCICGAADEYRSILRVVWSSAHAEGVSGWEARELCNLASSAILRLHLRQEGTSQPRGGDTGFWQEARTAALSAAAVRGVRPGRATTSSGREHAEQCAEQHPVPVCVLPHEGALAGGYVHATSEATAGDGDFQLEGLTALCVCPDSPRYKQMGNAVTVPVIRWIAERLLAEARRVAA